MPFDGGGTDITLPASADLSTYQYCFVTLDTAGRAAPGTTGAMILGVLQNKPAAADRAARVRTSGISLFKYGGTVQHGDLVASGVQGRGTTTAATAGINVGGYALANVGGSGNIHSLLVRPQIV